MEQWDPDGAGPLPAYVVVGGQFGQAGSVAVDNLALWNTATKTFASIGNGPGLNGAVHALMVDGNGHLVVGGEFTTVGGVAARSLARWDGAAWHAYGTGVNGKVLSLLADTGWRRNRIVCTEALGKGRRRPL